MNNITRSIFIVTLLLGGGGTLITHKESITSSSTPRTLATSTIQASSSPTPQPQKPIVQPTRPKTSQPGKCYVGGCSGQLCGDQPNMMSTCQYKEEFACYKSARCERQTSGKCGWTETGELKICLSGEVRLQ